MITRDGWNPSGPLAELHRKGNTLLVLTSFLTLFVVGFIILTCLAWANDNPYAWLCTFCSVLYTGGDAVCWVAVGGAGF